ncbi:hypothetical protein GCM10010449_11990 [Streptomyces rectiviolaceus]|uniref:Uncharacterized protein n=1 Tax=Streptomyces rectiviolaceus TaxID=332591 RepID=A0ABP6MB51_9ACTN
MKRKEATDALVARPSRTAVPRGPFRSASAPSGTPATDPMAQATVSASPIWVGERPTTRVKYRAEVT